MSTSRPTDDQHETGTEHRAAAASSRRRSTPTRVHRKPAPEASRETTQKITGVVGDASAQVSRSGEDVRKRGWFWHWNSIVTQYAPLLGLKGVGLLNSYTVWTDRREESPHRGYAFPSQQSEADFYGEDRAELITINKILVALDLIEIRKEMVLRVDAQGRRWKVPHNLYRVKDHGDDASLTTKDVLRVVDLADRDRAVYRYLRRIFSPRFSPIDHANVWHQILEEVRPTATWQKLAARTEKEERKASERTKAGHASRKSSGADLETVPTQDTGSEVSGIGKEPFSLPKRGDNAASESTHLATGSASNNDSATNAPAGQLREMATSVAPINNGSDVESGTTVEPGNNGSGQNRPGIVAAINTGRESSVAPANTTYHQLKTTTTEKGDEAKSVSEAKDADSDGERFGSQQAPDTARDETLAMQRFAEANDRQPTMAERRHLRQLADYASTIVETQALTGVSGWNLTGSAIEEAVSAGSSFVAPKRIREILSRWMRDGVPAEYAPGVIRVTGLSQGIAEAVTRTGASSHKAGRGEHTSPQDAVQLPNGRSAEMVWSNACREVAAILGHAASDALLAGTTIVAYALGDVTIRCASHEQGEALAGQAEAIERALRGQLRRPVRLVVDVAGDPVGSAGVASVESPAPAHDHHVVPGGSSQPVTMGSIPVFTIERSGMTNRQLWAMALNDVRDRGDIPAGDIDAWLRDAALLAVDEDGEMVTLVLGVPHALALRRVEARFRSVLVAALAALLDLPDHDLSLDVALLREWSARRSA